MGIVGKKKVTNGSEGESERVKGRIQNILLMSVKMS